jgi:hypothetical protein
MNPVRLVALLLGAVVSAPLSAQPAGSDKGGCGEVVQIETHDNTTTRYALVSPAKLAASSERIALVLLVGGSGYPHLDDQGCPRELRGNSLVRSLPLFHAAGFATALVDAPSDYHGEDGLAGFRSAPAHAEDLAKILADVRKRTQSRVWVIGTSRGAISAANVASRVTGEAAPAGVVLTSALMSGQTGQKKSWVAQSVFDLPLEAIRIPVLVVGHADDRCVRSPPALMGNITARTNGAREQVVTVTGGQGRAGPTGLAACEGRSPHGFLDQEAEVAAGIARFIRGGSY